MSHFNILLIYDFVSFSLQKYIDFGVLIGLPYFKSQKREHLMEGYDWSRLGGGGSSDILMPFPSLWTLSTPPPLPSSLPPLKEQAPPLPCCSLVLGEIMLSREKSQILDIC